MRVQSMRMVTIQSSNKSLNCSLIRTASVGVKMVDLPGLTSADLVDCGLHVVEYPALRNAAQHPEGLGHGVEQHLVGLERIGPHDERLAVRQLGVRGLQPGLLAGDHGPVLAPVELERLARLEHQRHECPAPAGLRVTLAVGLPRPHKRRHTVVGTIVSQDHEICVHLPGCAPLLARLAGLDPQPRRQLLGKRIQLAGPCRNLELRFYRIGPQVLANGVARQSRATLNLSDRDVLPEMPASDYTQ